MKIIICVILSVILIKIGNAAEKYPSNDGVFPFKCKPAIWQVTVPIEHEEHKVYLVGTCHDQRTEDLSASFRQTLAGLKEEVAQKNNAVVISECGDFSYSSDPNIIKNFISRISELTNDPLLALPIREGFEESCANESDLLNFLTQGWLTRLLEKQPELFSKELELLSSAFSLTIEIFDRLHPSFFLIAARAIGRVPMDFTITKDLESSISCSERTLKIHALDDPSVQLRVLETVPETIRSMSKEELQRDFLSITSGNLTQGVWFYKPEIWGWRMQETQNWFTMIKRTINENPLTIVITGRAHMDLPATPQCAIIPWFLENFVDAKVTRLA